ncbi:T9SS type A sorting domain-containing protein [Nemorincola caseinilytica]|uniref:T9SS type A sorting domain-containing protein n=2 Tax=Nemorincola caseinilytica TaxID=2054315 RepID=A0ABP8NBM7_9BACT
MSVTLNAGGTYTVSASNNPPTTPFPFPPTGVPCMGVWIDLNNNNSFEASELLGGSSSMTTSLSTFSITVPSTATAGTRRMRVVASSDPADYTALNTCPNLLMDIMGEVHDYTAVIAAAAPTCPPVTGLSVSAITSGSATLTWTAATGATGYEFAVTTSSTPPASGTYTATTTANATGLSPSTTYYAHVRTQCGTPYSTWVTSASFTTLPSTSTCAAVTGVTMSGITAGSATLNWAAVTGAIGYEWAVNTSATPPASGTLTTLLTATASGLTASTVYYAHVRTKCSATSFAAWTTNTFTTTAASTCPAITGLTATAITSVSATVSWTAVTSGGSLGYQYVINNTVTDPVGSGTNTTATSTSPTGLTPGTTYYAHVRDSCGVGNFSPWSTIPFTTLAAAGGCNAVTGLTATGITASSATLNWTMATGAVAAKWVVDNTPADPTISGTLSTTSTAAVSGLTGSTTYYAHVRDTCGPTSLSAWVTIPFTTLATVNIPNISNGTAPFSVAAYPNPVNHELTLQVSGIISSTATMVLTDITGKTIRTMHIDAYSTTIDVSALPQGIYIIRYSDGGHVQTLKVSKQ